jgi:hypothetical protein
MNRPNSSIIAANLPLLLTTDEMDVPWEVIADFFETFDLDEIRQMIVDIFLITLCAPKDELMGYSRSDILFTKKELIRFVEAALLLYKRSPNESL